MPYQEKVLPLALWSGSLGQVWETSESLLIGVFGTPHLWELTGIRDLPTTCHFTMRPLTEFDVQQLRNVPELAPLMEALDQAVYFGPSCVITLEIGTRLKRSLRMMDIGFHRERNLTDGDIILSLIRDNVSPGLIQQQVSFVPGTGIEHSATMRAAQALEDILKRRAGQVDVVPFPRLIEIYSRS